MSASSPPTSSRSSSLGRWIIMILAFALAFIGLLLPVPLYLFWYRPAEQAWGARSVASAGREYGRRMLLIAQE